MDPKVKRDVRHRRAFAAASSVEFGLVLLTALQIL